MTQQSHKVAMDSNGKVIVVEIELTGRLSSLCCEQSYIAKRLANSTRTAHSLTPPLLLTMGCRAFSCSAPLHSSWLQPRDPKLWLQRVRQ
mmetsp:Transcript_43228/g.84719  ORF Transcript_43228/g.84719 Transcript_43228/m.84719 type:complete len:90 (-) Transcript_43228:230-499(-)